MLAAGIASPDVTAEPIDIGARLELFVDDHLIENLIGAEQRMHHPTPHEVAIVFDKPWEGNGANYVTVFQDGPVYRMYYRGLNFKFVEGEVKVEHEQTCYAESVDGIHWTMPDLGVFDFKGSSRNNIVWKGKGSHNFTPFKDPNPDCKPDERYKALAGSPLHALKSVDGVHWSLVGKEPVITRGDFDSQNLAFWDELRGEYRDYHRKSRDGRDIMTCTSKDFFNWTEPVFLEYSPGRISELYTNQIIPYYRAPHIFLGFPTRYIDRGLTASTMVLPHPDVRRIRLAISQREATALTDVMLMSSRDALHFNVWAESFIRPGPQRPGSWIYGDHYQNWGLVETRSALHDAPNELSVYLTERTVGDIDQSQLRRYGLRIDGFVSIQAPLAGGELLTRPLRFSGSQLVINFSTSVAGSIRLEIQDAKGMALRGFTMEDSALIYGDELDRAVSWKGDPDLGKLAGKAVRLRFELKDADLYSIKFHDE